MIEAAILLEVLTELAAPPEQPAPDIPYWQEIVAAAEAEDMDPFVLAGIAKAESEFDPDAVGASGERGLCQVSQVAWREVMDEPYSQAFDPTLNLLAGARFYTGWRDWLSGPPHYETDIRWHLAAYNWGPGNVSVALTAGTSFDETPAQVQRHIARYLECIEWAREQ